MTTERYIKITGVMDNCQKCDDPERVDFRKNLLDYDYLC